MKAIILNDKDDTSKLSGKTIREVSFLSKQPSPHLIITFTDETYIMIETSENWEELLSIAALPFENQYPVWGNFSENLIPEYLQRQVDLGVVVINEEKIQKLRKSWRDVEYQQYLKLKEKYEGDSK